MLLCSPDEHASTVRVKKPLPPSFMVLLVGLLAVLPACGEQPGDSCQLGLERCGPLPGDGPPQTWSATGSLGAVRTGHTATLLTDGRVLVVGGVKPGLADATAEVYDPRTGTWSPTSSLATGRVYHTATRLLDGKVLVAGGQHLTDGSGGPGPAIPATAEVYDPAKGTWSLTGSLSMGRIEHTATLLPDGKVLVTGGVGEDTNASEGAEVYEPRTGTWSPTGPLSVERTTHAAVLLPNGKVLVAGGFSGDPTQGSTAEVYDPGTNTWSLTGSLARYHGADLAATLLADGKVLVTGGLDAYGGGSGTSPYLTTTEVYDPGTGTWSSTTGGLAAGRIKHTATLLQNGKVLVAGGHGGVITAEVYEPGTGTWSPTDNLSAPRADHTATLLPNGKVLVTGGSFLATTELYTP